MAAITMKASFPVLMLLGIALLACVSSRPDQENPFIFESNRFQTLFENENGHIRVLQKFDQRSKIFENLQNYRLLEYKSKPHTIFLPQQTDADFILVVLSGRAILTVLKPDDRNSFNLERGDTIRLPAGTVAYLVNRDDDEDLRVIDLAIPINRPGQLQSFLFSGNQNQPSILSGFSKNILQASFNTDYEEIEKVLLEGHAKEAQQRRSLRDKRQQSQEEDVIAKLSRRQIEELSKNAKSSSKKSVSSEFEPFNLRSRNPIYSNKFGKFFEVTPEKNPQLQNLDILVNSVEIKEGSLLLPHYNSRAIVIVTVNEGNGDFELVGLRNEKQQGQRKEDDEEEEQEEEEINKQVINYKAKLSQGDVFIIPAGHPVAIRASSNLNLLGFGINAENNQRNFLAGEEDNVISQIHPPVKDLAFPGSAQEVDRLLGNQKQSYFANAQPQQRERGSHETRDRLSSILDAF
ncbi:vicilin-like [Vicia villosa]|uniref:vicilin-like n=1 Tax=Vicia villosa TaxID=3911 RepID=UPI00273C833D|nr:vicilin-like [Vicia villosa]